MKKIISKLSSTEKFVFSLLSGWFLVQVILFIIGAEDSPSWASKRFWPLDEGEIGDIYDSTEFIILGIIPLFVFFLYIFLNQKDTLDNTKEEIKRIKIKLFENKKTLISFVVKILLSIVLLIVGLFIMGAPIPFFYGRILLRIALFVLVLYCIKFVWQKKQAK